MSEITQRLQQLVRLIDIKAVELEQASLKLQAEQQVFAQEEAQLDRLTAYYSEYSSPKSQPNQPEMMAMRGAFMGQLNEGITQQKQVVAKAQVRLDSAQTAWFQLRKFKEMLEEKVSDLEKMRADAAEKRLDAEIQEFVQSRQSR
jgi:flagellar export protein FliJ